MSKYDKDVKSYIIDNVSIVDVVASRLKLERAGAAYRALCPFHSEKTASFIVNESRKNYRCFGCNEHGNAIDFVMKTENLGFLEAMEALAARYGLDLSPFENKENRAERQLDNKIYEMNASAMEFFSQSLKHSRAAIEYLARRKLKFETIGHFKLGYAPKSWTALVDYLKKKNYSEQDIISSGLSVKSEKGLFDRFRNRLMFPILDHRQRCLGFGARAMDGEMPKYLNSSEGRVFKKSYILYGEGFQSGFKPSDYVILVEGYMDVIQLFQFGFGNVYASMGTALTENQVKKISSKAKKVYFAYDMDAAGRKAISKSLHLLEEQKLETEIMMLDGAKDPDEFLLKYGRRAFEKKMTDSMGVIRFRLDMIRQGRDLSKPSERQDYIIDALNLFASDLNELGAEIHIQELAEMCRVQPDTLLGEYKRLRRIVNNESGVGEVKKPETEITEFKNADLNKSQVQRETADNDLDKQLRQLETRMLAYASYDVDFAGDIYEYVSDFVSEKVVEALSMLMLYYVDGHSYVDTEFAVNFDADLAYFINECRKRVAAYSRDNANKMHARWLSLIAEKKLREIDREIEDLNFSTSETAEVEKRMLIEKRKNLLTSARKIVKSIN